VVTSGAADMDILVRLFVWILNYTYGKRVSPTVCPEIPGQDKVVQEYRDELESRRKDQLVRNFQSSAPPVQSAVDYNELQWTLYTRTAETKTEFLFYRERSVTKVIDKSTITNRQEIAALRRLIRRNVADNVLLDD
jgi:hypothetical protein